MTYERDFGPVAKSRTREIRVSVQEFKDRPVLNIRRWCEPYDGDEWRPTKQGIAFAVEQPPGPRSGATGGRSPREGETGLIDDEPAIQAAE